MADQPTAGPPLQFQQADGIAVITINRPWVRNAFTIAMWRELQQLADQIAAESAIRVLVLQGAGDEAFTAGSDIRELGEMDRSEISSNFQVIEDAITAVERLPIPTIACLNGHAVGGGLELALACDLRVASEQAMLGMPVARIGIMISPRFAKRLVHLVGPSRTKDLLYTGRLVSASEAQAMGLVNYLTPSHQLRQTTREVAQRIARHSGASVRAAKHAVGLCLPLSEAASDSGAYFIDPTEDFAEGVSAFLEKRAPRFHPNPVPTEGK